MHENTPSNQLNRWIYLIIHGLDQQQELWIIKFQGTKYCYCYRCDRKFLHLSCMLSCNLVMLCLWFTVIWAGISSSGCVVCGGQGVCGWRHWRWPVLCHFLHDHHRGRYPASYQHFWSVCCPQGKKTLCHCGECSVIVVWCVIIIIFKWNI